MRPRDKWAADRSNAASAAVPLKAKKSAYLSFENGGPYRMKMGLLPLPSEEWIEIDEEFASQLATKQALLNASHADVFVALPEAKLASEETLELVLNHLRQYYSTIFSFEGYQVLNKLTGKSWNLKNSSLHPLDQVGRLVQEDFCILQSNGTNYVLTAGAVCFPANWRLSDKIGRSITAVHEPVPGYVDKLDTLVNRFFDNLQPNALVWRSNWLVLDNPALFQVAREPMTENITNTNAGEKLWFRVERQTFQRLPHSLAVLFTIRTHVIQLQQAILTSKRAKDFAAVVRTMPELTLQYRHMVDIVPALLTWLDVRAKA